MFIHLGSCNVSTRAFLKFNVFLLERYLTYLIFAFGVLCRAFCDPPKSNLLIFQEVTVVRLNLPVYA